MTRGGVALLLLGVWIGSLGWLVRREYFRPSSQLAVVSAATVPPGATFYSVFMNGTQIGFASNTVDTVPGGIYVSDILEIFVPVLGSTQRLNAHTKVNLSKALQLIGFEAKIEGDANRFVAHGEVLGDSLLAVEITTGERTEMIAVPLREPVVLPAYLPLRLSFGPGIEVGDSHTVALYDPFTFQEKMVDIAITGDSTFIIPDSAVFDSTAMRWEAIHWDTLYARRIEQHAGGLRTETWIDELGRVVQYRSPVGFVISRSVYELAYENFRRGDGVGAALRPEVIAQTVIAANASLEVDELAQVRVVLSGTELNGFQLEGGRQQLIADTLIVTRETPDQLDADYMLPNLSLRFAQFVRPEPLIQSDDERLLALARRIVGRTRNARRAAESINRWVFEEITKEVTAGVPNAVRVLENRSGDCNEHTVLFVALARATGLPTRTAAGLIYIDGSFYYHAWAEVFLGDWVAFDPTLGQTPADASHLRFTVGGLARQLELTRLIGRVSLDVVETRNS